MSVTIARELGERLGERRLHAVTCGRERREPAAVLGAERRDQERSGARVAAFSETARDDGVERPVVRAAPNEELECAHELVPELGRMQEK